MGLVQFVCDNLCFCKKKLSRQDLKSDLKTLAWRIRLHTIICSFIFDRIVVSVCLLFVVWTTVSICAMETSYLPDFRPSKTLSTSSVTQKPEATQKTTWGSSLWPSRRKIVFSLFVLVTGTNVTKCVCVLVTVRS